MAMDDVEQGQETQEPVSVDGEGQEGTQEAPPEEPAQEAQESEGEEEAKAKGEEQAGEEAGETEEAPPATQETPEQKHKRAGGYQRKIERLERERQMLLEQLHRSTPQPKAEPAKPKTPSEEAVDYIDKLVEQRLAAKDAQRQAEARTAEFQRRAAEVRTAHPDFDEALQSVDVPVSEALGHVLLTSERGPEIMYQLAKNPAELARLSALPPLDAAREIGRLEAKSASGAAPQKPKPANRPPAPPSKVGGSSSSTRSLEDLPISEYKRAFRSGRR